MFIWRIYEIIVLFCWLKHRREVCVLINYREQAIDLGMLRAPIISLHINDEEFNHM